MTVVLYGVTMIFFSNMIFHLDFKETFEKANQSLNTIAQTYHVPTERLYRHEISIEILYSFRFLLILIA